MPPHPMRSFAINALVAVLAMFACLALAEIGIRVLAPQPTGPSQFVFDPVLGDIPVPGQHGRRTLPGVYDYTYTNNSLGLRGKEIDRSGASGERVLFLGDSFTYGIGVSDGQSFADLTGRFLAAHKPPFELVNAGNPGTGTDYALKFYRALGREMKPRLVALFFFANDFEDNGFAKYYGVTANGGVEEKALASSVGARKQVLSANRFYNWLISWSHTANLVKQFAINLMLNRRVAGDGPPTAVVSYRNEGGYSTPANIAATGVLLGALRDAAAADGADFIVFYVPPRENVANFREKASPARDEAALTQIAAALGIDLFSLTPVLAGLDRDLAGLYFAEGHWNAVAHEVVAGVVADVLADRLQHR
jgi:lysophospholipase L1-like esterase